MAEALRDFFDREYEKLVAKMVKIWGVGVGRGAGGGATVGDSGGGSGELVDGGALIPKKSSSPGASTETKPLRAKSPQLKSSDGKTKQILARSHKS